MLLMDPLTIRFSMISAVCPMGSNPISIIPQLFSIILSN